MKQGQSFEQIIERVQREAEARHDFYAPTDALCLTSEGDGSLLHTPAGDLTLREAAHLHLAEVTGIDRRYYTRLRRDAPQLLDQNVNHWLRRSGSQSRLIRALDTEVRAITSPRFGILDNDALLRVAEPIIRDIGAEVESCDISDERLIVKVTSARLRGDVKVNDTVQVGLVLRNSEVRAGAVEVDVFVSRLVCTNGMIVSSGSNGVRRRHVGRVWGGDGDSYALVPETAERTTWEQDIWQQVGESVRAAVSADSFQALLQRLQATTQLQTNAEPQQVVERLGQESAWGRKCSNRSSAILSRTMMARYGRFSMPSRAVRKM